MDAERLTLRSREAVGRAQRLAAERNHQTVEPADLLAALLADPEA